jgi:hypothetical protein
LRTCNGITLPCTSSFGTYCGFVTHKTTNTAIKPPNLYHIIFSWMICGNFNVNTIDINNELSSKINVLNSWSKISKKQKSILCVIDGFFPVGADACWFYSGICCFVITVFTVFRMLTDFVCLYNYEFRLFLCKIVRSSVILLLPLFMLVI